MPFFTAEDRDIVSLKTSIIQYKMKRDALEVAIRLKVARIDNSLWRDFSPSASPLFKLTPPFSHAFLLDICYFSWIWCHGLAHTRTSHIAQSQPADHLFKYNLDCFHDLFIYGSHEIHRIGWLCASQHPIRTLTSNAMRWCIIVIVCTVGSVCLRGWLLHIE